MLAFIGENKESVDAWCICETHKAGEAAEETAHKINGMGLDAFMTRAKPSGQGGSREGTAIFADPRMQGTHMMEGCKETGEKSSRKEGGETNLPYEDITPIRVQGRSRR